MAEHNDSENNLDFIAQDGSYQEKVLDYQYNLKTSNPIEIAAGNVTGYSKVNKFGSNSSVGTTLTPVCGSGFYRTPNAVETLEILSSDADDTVAGAGARTITIQGLDGTGAFQEVTTDLDGTTAAAVSGSWLRVYRMWVSSTGTYSTQSVSGQQGTITLRASGGGDTWAIIGVDGLGLGQSQIGVYTIPLGKVAYLRSFQYSVDTNKTVNLYFFKRESITDTVAPFQAMRLQSVYEGITGDGSFKFDTASKYDELTDIGFMAKAGTGTASVSVEFELILVNK